MRNYLGISCLGWENLLADKGFGDIAVFDALGYVPGFIVRIDPRTIKEQIEERYAYFGAWTKMAILDGEHSNAEPGDVVFNAQTLGFEGPGDPVLMPHAKFEHNGERIYAYRFAIFVVIDAQGDAWYTRLD